MAMRLVYFLAVLGFVQCELVNLRCNGIRNFVTGHNKRRLQLAEGKVPGQPAASKMNSIIWDDELAAKAAAWASKNKYGHNPDRTIPSDRFHTGENIYQVGTNGHLGDLDLELPMAAWWDEYKHYQYKPLEAGQTGPTTLHYTQMAWSDSIYLGCAISLYKKDEWSFAFVVCNYGPTGNYIGRAPYQSGNASGHLSCDSKNCTRPYGSTC